MAVCRYFLSIHQNCQQSLRQILRHSKNLTLVPDISESNHRTNFYFFLFDKQGIPVLIWIYSQFLPCQFFWNLVESDLLKKYNYSLGILNCNYNFGPGIMIYHIFRFSVSRSIPQIFLVIFWWLWNKNYFWIFHGAGNFLLFLERSLKKSKKFALV